MDSCVRCGLEGCTTPCVFCRTEVCFCCKVQHICDKCEMSNKENETPNTPKKPGTPSKRLSNVPKPGKSTDPEPKMKENDAKEDEAKAVKKTTVQLQQICEQFKKMAVGGRLTMCNFERYFELMDFIKRHQSDGEEFKWEPANILYKVKNCPQCGYNFTTSPCVFCQTNVCSYCKVLNICDNCAVPNKPIKFETQQENCPSNEAKLGRSTDSDEQENCPSNEPILERSTDSDEVDDCPANTPILERSTDSDATDDADTAEEKQVPEALSEKKAAKEELQRLRDEFKRLEAEGRPTMCTNFERQIELMNILKAYDDSDESETDKSEEEAESSVYWTDRIIETVKWGWRKIWGDGDANSE